MKKLLFFFILVVAVISVKYSLKEPRVNTLLLDNVEALAAYEQDMPHTCLGSGSVDCPISKRIDTGNLGIEISAHNNRNHANPTQ